jgi:hypothetical protein
MPPGASSFVKSERGPFLPHGKLPFKLFMYDDLAEY